jgi:agmatine deiminase
MTDMTRKAAGLMSGTPREAGFTMPAEWDQHERCWMAWPHRTDLYGKRLPAIQRGYARVAQAIRQFEPMTMLAAHEAAEEARQLCGPDVEVMPFDLDDAWLRDSGPTFLRHASGKRAGVSWRFNAWGGKHQPWDKDDTLAGGLLDRLGLPWYRSSLTLEGGAFHVDGEGTLLTTETCVLNPNRNLGWSKKEAEAELKQALGVEKIIWLPGDPGELETDGHVDGLACFVRPGVVLVETNPYPDDPHAAVLRENLKALEGQCDARGRTLEFLFIEEAADAEATSQIFSRSYINFYLANGGVVMPGFGIDADARVKEVVARAYPDRRVVQVDIADIAPGGGGIHCITQQEPL